MRMLKNCGIVLASLILTAVVLEIGVRVGLHFRSSYDVEMWKYGTQLKQRADSPDMSHEHIPGARGHLYGVDIAINSKGLRDREFDYAPAPGSYRVLFLGDSLTLGWGVEFDRIFSKLLEPVLSSGLHRPVEVINSGVGNYNTVQERAYFEREGHKYGPHHVMLLYFINDAEPTPVYESATLKENSMLVVFIWSRMTKLMTRLGLRSNFHNYYEDLYADNSRGWEASREALRALHTRAMADRFSFTVFVCPELRQIRPGYAFAEQHAKILSFLQANGIDHVDLLPHFQQRSEPESAFWVSAEDSHPNALGHQIIADGVADHVLANGVGSAQ